MAQASPHQSEMLSFNSKDGAEHHLVTRDKITHSLLNRINVLFDGVCLKFREGTTTIKILNLRLNNILF